MKVQLKVLYKQWHASVVSVARVLMIPESQLPK